MRPKLAIAMAALLAALLAACAHTAYGPRRTLLPQDGVAVLSSRHGRSSVLLLAEFPGLRGTRALLLDTGTDRTLLDYQLARELGLKALEPEAVVTATGDAAPAMLLERIPEMRIGEAAFCDVDAIGIDLSQLRENGGLPILGIAGCDLFRQGLLEIDYPGRTVRLLPRSAAPAGGGHRFEERTPWLWAEVGGKRLRLLLDTGFQQSLALPPGCDVPFVFPPRPAGDIASISGTEPKEYARLRGDLRVGNLRWNEPSALIVPGSPKLGARLLRGTRILLDASGGRCWLER